MGAGGLTSLVLFFLIYKISTWNAQLAELWSGLNDGGQEKGPDQATFIPHHVPHKRAQPPIRLSSVVAGYRRARRGCWPREVGRNG